MKPRLPATTRRRFLGQAAAAALGAAPLAAAIDRVPVVDTHLHCFAGNNDPRFPYHARAPYRPEAAATPEHLLECMDGAGVDFAIVVHPEPYQDDHRYLEHCLAVGKKRLKGTCLFFADRAGSVEKMPALVKKCSIAAARIHAYAPDRLPPFGKPALRRLWALATDLGLAVQLHFEPRYAPGFEPLIREFKETTVIIDHLGRPLQGSAAEHEVVLRWARFPNTVIKLSALRSRREYPHRDLAPIVRRVIDSFGAGRMVHGGGFGAGATAASYRAYRERARELLSPLRRADQDKVLGGNAAHLFGFAP